MHRGIILAGGKGTRLLPATRITNKHLIPILETPMILYPLATLKVMGITDIMIVSGGNHIGDFADFLGDGSDYGVHLTYRVQKEAGGIAQALGLAADFARGENVAVILGDNIFDNVVLAERFVWDRPFSLSNAHLFVKEVENPQRFGVLALDNRGGFIIEEKPKNPKTNRAVTGLYIYPPEVFDIVPTLVPSGRGELEITDVNNYFIEMKKCMAHEFPGFWSDAGTPDSLFEVIKWVKSKSHE